MTILEGNDNRSDLMRAVDAAYFKAVAVVFDRMVKDLEHAQQLPLVRTDMHKSLDRVRTVHAEMSQRVMDLEA
jgi:ATP-dependent helicase YprA (DUF1998 family)